MRAISTRVAVFVMSIMCIVAFWPTAAARGIESSRVTTLATNGVQPDVSSRLVGWLEPSGPAFAVSVWNRASGLASTITTTTTYRSGLKVSGDLAVWSEPAARFYYNARTGETVRLATSGGEIDTDGRYVVFRTAQGLRFHDSYTLEGGSVPDSAGMALDVANGIVVWADIESELEGEAVYTLQACELRNLRRSQLAGPMRSRVPEVFTDGRFLLLKGLTHTVYDLRSGSRTTFAGPLDDSLLDAGIWEVSDNATTDRTTHSLYALAGSPAFRSFQATGFAGMALSESTVLYGSDEGSGTWTLRTGELYFGAASTVDTTTLPYNLRGDADLFAWNVKVGDDVHVRLADLYAARRIEGRTRFDVALDAAQQTYPGWSEVTDVVIASGDDAAAADALVAAGLCYRYNAPLLLGSRASAPAATRAAVREIVEVNGAVRLHVVGGTASLPNSVIDSLVTAGGGPSVVTVERISGTNRYTLAEAVARKIAEGGRSSIPVALVANGAEPGKFFDALSLSAISRATGYPVLLVTATAVPAPTSRAIRAIGTSETVVAGGPASVSGSVLRSLPGSVRWAGANRYDCSANIARQAGQRGWIRSSAPVVAARIPDALVGGALAGASDSPLLVTPSAASHASTRQYLRDTRGKRRDLFVMGQYDSVSARTLSELSRAAWNSQ